MAAAALAIVMVGPRLAKVADRLADRTGLGEAVTGALLLGASTSLPGVVATAVGSASGDGGFALSNALGGIAVQTSFIPIADLSHRVNLEHAAASLSNLLQSTLVIVLLALTAVAIATPEVAVAGLHPVSVVLVAVYIYGLRVTRQAERTPMWIPEETAETIIDRQDEPEPGEHLSQLWVRFGLFAVVLAAAGWVVGRAGLSLAAATGFTSSEVATLLTGVVTSFPELVILLAAVRIGAPTLGVGTIIGGNAFDTLFIPVADAFFRGGSVYHAVPTETVFVLALTLLLTAVFTGGLLSRQQRGIGFEGLAIAIIYVGGMAALLLWM